MFMYMKDDHIRKAQLYQGYNMQIGVDKYIVAVDIFQEKNDIQIMALFMNIMEEKLGFRYPSITADSEYESEEGDTHLKANKQTAYIKSQNYVK